MKRLVNWKQRNFIVTASSLAFYMAAGAGAPAWADEAVTASTDVTEVVVTGIRRGLQTSVTTKKTSDGIVEVVSAEDIGKLPDSSIAESLARLPGLTAQRLDGRAQVISIRGLGPDFTGTLLNGREQVSTGDNRGVEFDQYPSEILSGVVVHKTPNAALIGQGLAGTADLQTIRPLKYGRPIAAINGRYEFNSQHDLNPDAPNTGHRISATFVDQFFDKKLGVALAVSDMSSPTQSRRFNAWGYGTAPDGNLVIGGAKPYNQSNNLERTGYIGVLEFRPNDAVTSSLDVYHSTFNESQILRGIEIPLFYSGATLQPGYTVKDGMIVDGQFTGVKGVMRNDLNRRHATLNSAGWNLAYRVSDTFSVALDLSHSRSDRRDILVETYTGTGPNGEGATDTFDFETTAGAGTTFDAGLDYGDPGNFVLTDPLGWGGGVVGGALTQGGYYNIPDVSDELNAIRLSAKKILSRGIFSSVEFGVNSSRREKIKHVDENFLTFGGRSGPGVPLSHAIPDDAIIGTTGFDMVGIDAILAYDPMRLINSGVYTLVSDTMTPVVQVRNWSVLEKVETAYVMADIDTDLGGVGLAGNAGIQVVKTDQFSNGAAINPADFDHPAVASGGDKYTYVLPSLNLNFDFGNNTYIRFGAARSLARARMDDLRASQSFNMTPALLTSTDPNKSFFSASGGNPYLRPYIADGVDISVEHYFGKSAYVAAAGYYKKLSNFVDSNAQSLSDFSEFLFLLTPEMQSQLGTTYGIVSGPANGEGGFIKGLEFSGALQGGLINERLDDFGVIMSASFTDSRIVPANGGAAIDMPGLSGTVVNSTLYYEKSGFNARISNRYRGRFLGEVAGVSASRVYRTVAAESVLDAQLSYEFRGGPFTGVTLFLQANNLTDEPFKTYENGDPRRTIDYQTYGTSYLIGFSYRH